MKEKIKNYQKLLEEFEAKSTEHFKEALRIYPSKHLINNNKEWEKIVEKQAKYYIAKNEFWLEQLKERYTLTDYECAELRSELLSDFLSEK